MHRISGIRAARERLSPSRPGVERIAILALALLAAIAWLGAAGCGTATSRAATPHATATVHPTATPTPTARDELILRALGGMAQSVTTTSDAGSGALVVSITIGGTIPNGDAVIAAAHERVKTLCFLALRTLWTTGTAAPTGSVTIVVLGPMLDEYANHIINLYGSAIVEPRTGARLDWARLTPDSAWALYDHVFLVNYFYPVD